MSESERAAAEAAQRAEGASELAPDTGPGDPGRASSVRLSKESRRVTSSSERQIKVERAQKCLENAALVTKRIKERRRATAELLGKPFEDDEAFDTSSELASAASARTGHSAAASDVASHMSVEDALNIPGISESLANTLKQKEILMERIKQYKERSKPIQRPATKSSKPTFPSRLTPSGVEDATQIKRPIDKLDAAQLQSTIKEKETAMSIMQVKMRAMETTILDLQEKISEKDSLIEAKTKATSLMSDNLSKKEKDSVNLLEDTRQQMVKMQENFVAMENEWKQEKQRLLNDIEVKNERINHLEQANAVLENSRFEISLAHSKLSEEIELKSKLISDLERKLMDFTEEREEIKEFSEVEKGSQEISNMVEMTKRIELLEQLNCQIRQTNFELENKLANLYPEAKTPEPAIQMKASPQMTRKRGKSASRNTSAKVKSPWSSLAEGTSQETPIKSPTKSDSIKDSTSKMELIIQSLNKEIVDKELLISQKNLLIESLQGVVSEKEEELKSYLCSKPVTVEIGLSCDTLEQKSIEISSSMPIIKAVDTVSSGECGEDQRHMTMEELLNELNATREQIASLNAELEAANKNMVKVKSAHKLKLKQMQKTIDGFSKMSDSNAEVSKLSDEVNQLTQKVAELEEDKGNLQLHLVDYDSGRLTETDSHRKLLEIEALAEARLKAISDLETQKFDLVQELHLLQQKNSEMDDKLTDLQQLQSEHVCTEIRSVQLEEELDQAIAANKELELVIENLKHDKEHTKQTVKDFQDNIFELTNKLEHYVQENIDLTDRLEKLSAEKVSSAESIEMVESLTVQEKMELEEYNKKMSYSKETLVETGHEKLSSEEVEKVEFNDNLVKLSEESAELHKKIELFTQERHEVMEKMNELKLKNEDLLNKINEINQQKAGLETQVQSMLQEKDQINKLNEDLLNQIEKLKKEQVEVLRENSGLIKPSLTDDVIVESESTSKDVADIVSGDTTNQDDKPQASKTKSAKQLTKEILKLKNVIKEREAEIADCQMKILSLEEQHQKQADIIKNNMINDNAVKNLSEENKQLKDELSFLKLQTEYIPSMQTYCNEIEALKQSNEGLQNVINNGQAEYIALITTRDLKIQELERMLIDYEGKIAIYVQSLQEKDKDITEYLNQITQLNSVSQKLKSTIEVLEEEKVKDQNGELIKNLNMQIMNFQSLINEQESKLKMYEDERNKLISLQFEYTEKNATLEIEIEKLYNSILEKDTILMELQDIQKKHNSEVLEISNQCKEKDEEIHEIKLQLRKESIENENLRMALSEIDAYKSDHALEIEKLEKEFETKLIEKNLEINENIAALEHKNKELMEKLKKFAVNLKKKANICAELERKVSEMQSVIENKESEIESLRHKVDDFASLQSQVISLSRELECLKSEGTHFEQNKVQELEALVAFLSEEKSNIIDQQRHLENNLIAAKQEAEVLVYNNASLTNELETQHHQSQDLRANIQMLKRKLVEYEDEQKSNSDLNTKISVLEAEIHQKQMQISDLLNKIDNIQQEFNTFKFGHDAKIQERDLFIENLESETANYRNRISRLEESISIMEDRRHSLERKADQLGSQLEEKQKAYCDYTNNEDELVNRLAVLMDHDQVVEKQLHEIEKENTEMHNKIQKLIDDNQNLHKNLMLTQEECMHLKDNSNKVHQAELDSARQSINQLENQIKKISTDNMIAMKRQQEDINSLEAEFNLQIEDNIKEKKALSEKYEKTLEQNDQLEKHLKVYAENVRSLTENLEELTKINQRLEQKSINDEATQNQNYIDQYVSEINNLHSIINKNNSDIHELKHLQEVNLNTVTSFESKLHDLKVEDSKKEKEVDLLRGQLQNSLSDAENSNKTIDQLKALVAELQENLQERDLQIGKNISDPAFGYLPSSSDSEKIPYIPDTKFDLHSLESQLCADGEEQAIKKIQAQEFTKEDVVEEVIIPKKAYICYDPPLEHNVKPSQLCSEQQVDPFNSDEGWGLDDNTADSENHDYLSEVSRLSNDNEKLKQEIASSNTKLAKALKKLRELKLNNDRLVNDLKTANQMSQFNLLDTTIEDELKNQINELNEKITEMATEIGKEKREKDALSKHNELLKNANDRFMESKEKIDNEILTWKLKFKEANDKVSSFEWGEDQERSQTKQLQYEVTTDKTRNKNDFEQIESENDELNTLVEQLTRHNTELSVMKMKQEEEILTLSNDLSNLKSQYQIEQEDFEKENLNLKSVIMGLESNLSSINNQKFCEKCETYSLESLELKKLIEDLNHDKDSLASTVKQLYIDIEAAREECSRYESSNRLLLCEISELKESLKVANEQVSLIKSTSNDQESLIKKCNDLEENCGTLKSELETLLSQHNSLQTQMSGASDKIVLYEARIADFEKKTNNLNEENDQLLSTVAELRSTVSSAVDQRGYEVAEMWKQHLAQREADFSNLEHELREQISTMESKYEHLLDNVQSSTQEETSKLIMMEQMSSLQAKLKDKEDHLISLQSKFTEMVSEMEMMRSEMEDEKLIHENKLLNQQEESDQQRGEFEKESKSEMSNKDFTISELRSELERHKEINEMLTNKVHTSNETIDSLQNNIADLASKVCLKDNEIVQKVQEYNVILNHRNEEFESLRQQLIEYEKKVEELSFEKESELAIMRLKMHEQSSNYENVQSKLESEKTELAEILSQKIEECTRLNRQLADLNRSLQGDSVRMSEMRSALESQEIEIVTLKDEIDNMQILLESSAAKVAKHVTFASDTKPGTESGEASGESLQSEDVVPRAELDLALYMLHQRDMRCEELTMELTGLLEERDTLQLRLSDCLRVHEDLRARAAAAGLEPLAAAPNLFHAPSARTSTEAEPHQHNPSLHDKLDELRSVRQGRDVRLRQDSERRELDMQLLQRDVSRLPPEAADQLRQAHYTLSRDSQSTSTVLLNWLRGKSTPKVVHM